jgi:hypothetical protein
MFSSHNHFLSFDPKLSLQFKESRKLIRMKQLKEGANMSCNILSIWSWQNFTIWIKLEISSSCVLNNMYSWYSIVRQNYWVNFLSDRSTIIISFPFFYLFSHVLFLVCYRRPETSFLWITHPLRSMKHIVYPNLKRLAIMGIISFATFVLLYFLICFIIKKVTD